MSDKYGEYNTVLLSAIAINYKLVSSFIETMKE